MVFEPHSKYAHYLSRFVVDLPDRQWPNQRQVKAPIWCSVDLRDGNQALINPMGIYRKRLFFQTLLDIGFKEIEVGFPSASQLEFDFLRILIDEQLIPQDVTLQVLTQSREHLIRRTFDSLVGAKVAIVHLYNSTSEVQRRVVFRKEKKEIIQLAESGTELIKKLAADSDTKIIFQYSPESFTGTELEFSKEICEAVLEKWNPDQDQKIILNLPATVEMSTPNIYADQIEWFSRNVSGRDRYILSLHTHNDRGTGVAATELGLLAGADRVEGTLFGNGERTGNVDIVTLALNLFSQGIAPDLDLSKIEHIRKISEECTEIPVDCRHPYAGELVFTAFSGSHQDAINKGMTVQDPNGLWEVPYIPLDPADIGRKYDAIVRINSQSGKGGVAYVLKAEFGIDLPKEMHAEFSEIVQKHSEQTGGEIIPQTLKDIFDNEYIKATTPLHLSGATFSPSALDPRGSRIGLNICKDGQEIYVEAEGIGPIDAAVRAIADSSLANVRVLMFSQHSCDAGSDAQAVTFLRIEGEKGATAYGVGIDPNTSLSALNALFSAINRLPR